MTADVYPLNGLTERHLSALICDRSPDDAADSMQFCNADLKAAGIFCFCLPFEEKKCHM